MKHLLFAMILLGLAGTVGGCFPSTVSPACQATIDDCLRRCPPSGPSTEGPQTDFPSDFRDECVRQCHDSPCGK
jgi:hypothetical protein